MYIVIIVLGILCWQVYRLSKALDMDDNVDERFGEKMKKLWERMGKMKWGVIVFIIWALWATAVIKLSSMVQDRTDKRICTLEQKVSELEKIIYLPNYVETEGFEHEKEKI